tara:strand:+ start:916 stop:1647 length:732 start_codon:yes stop_codon:yes gene_type:complete
MIIGNISFGNLVLRAAGFAGVALVVSCSGADKGGFGGGGEHVDIIEDTGKNTGSVDTETSTTDTSVQTTDTAATTVDTSDTGDTADTGTTEPQIEGTGYDRGDIAYDLVAPDQNDDEWKLHSQIGEVIVLLIGDGYDPNFTTMSGYLGELESKYGIETAALLLSDLYEAPADLYDADAWATSHSAPTVLYDPSAERSLQLEWAPIVRPQLFVIDTEMTIFWINSGYTALTQLEEKIEDLVYGN